MQEIDNIIILACLSIALFDLLFLMKKVREIDSKMDATLIGVCRILYGDPEFGFSGLLDSQISDKNPGSGDKKP